jgi:plasmid stability protein
MPNISVKDVPEQWANLLRQRAARNHRSLQGELMAIIEQAVLEPSMGTGPSDGIAQDQAGHTRANGRGVVVGFDRFGHAIVRQGWKTVDQVAAELKAKYPEPVTDVPRGVDIIRADRDAR